MSQTKEVQRLLSRSRGCTMYDICIICRSVSPSRRIHDLREKGWTITKKKIDGKNFHRFYGKPPKKPVE